MNIESVAVEPTFETHAKASIEASEDTIMLASFLMAVLNKTGPITLSEEDCEAVTVETHSVNLRSTPGGGFILSVGEIADDEDETEDEE